MPSWMTNILSVVPRAVEYSRAEMMMCPTSVFDPSCDILSYPTTIRVASVPELASLWLRLYEYAFDDRARVRAPQG